SDPLIKRVIIEMIEVSTGRRKLERYYREIRDMNLPPKQIWETALEKLAIEMQYDQAQLAKIPADGPLVLISNHPFGLVDGIILGYMMSRIRDSFVVMINEVLCRDERLAPMAQHLVPIDFRETEEALRTNIETRRQVVERLQNGEAMAIFPAGGISTSPKPWSRPQDLEWKRFVAKVIQLSEATVVPMYVHGQNSRLFQIVSQFSMTLRLGLLMNETCNKIGQPVQIEIGDPIPYETLAPMKNRQVLLNHLRDVTFGLSDDLRKYH
ncbi:MAG: lysophospholipid acyltransferase family protein, partial [Pseudomonadota bacterium]